MDFLGLAEDRHPGSRHSLDRADPPRQKYAERFESASEPAGQRGARVPLAVADDADRGLMARLFPHSAAGHSVYRGGPVLGGGDGREAQAFRSGCRDSERGGDRGSGVLVSHAGADPPGAAGLRFIVRPPSLFASRWAQPRLDHFFCRAVYRARRTLCRDLCAAGLADIGVWRRSPGARDSERAVLRLPGRKTRRYVRGGRHSDALALSLLQRDLVFDRPDPPFRTKTVLAQGASPGRQPLLQHPPGVTDPLIRSLWSRLSF